MNTALIAMAILGCGDAGDQCQTVRVEAPRFATIEACNAAAADTLTRYTGLTYPVVAVRCQKAAVPTLATANVQPNG